MELISNAWWGINDMFISRMPFAYQNPFICTMWPDAKCPSFETEGFSFWSYLLTLAFAGPLTFIIQSFIISWLTGEWRDRRKTFAREIAISIVVLVATSPFMAVSYKLSLEGYLGYVYHDVSTMTIPGMLAQVLLFNIVADTWFYWVHRLFHEVEWLYRSSHYLHHSAHPVNTFMGSGGDVLELITQGEMQVFVPPLFVPIASFLFILNAIFLQGYVLLLHNGKRYRLPYHNYIIDPYEHNIHHYYGYNNYNFGLYFTFWDRLMGTHKTRFPAGWKKDDDASSPSSSSSPSSPSLPSLRTFREAFNAVVFNYF